MVLRSLKLTNFRNLGGEFALSNGVNVIIGLNGVGKTNFLEAVGLLSYGKSFRTNHELFTIKNNLSDSSNLIFNRLEGHIFDSLGGEIVREVIIEQTINTNGNGCRKALKIDGNKTPLLKFVKNFYTIIFSPNTIDLVISSPSLRRRDLDDFLSVYDERYLNEISEYRKIIRNRNKVLERFAENKANKQEIVFWNKRLIDLGAKIIFKRVEFFEEVNPLILKLAKELFNFDIDGLFVEYISKFTATKVLEDIQESFRLKINQNLNKEIYAGTTLYGPQREDFKFMLNGKELKEFGSRGQQRLSAFLYKIAQWKVLKDKMNIIPMLLLDDLFSELDKKVVGKICKFLSSIDGQIIITSTSKRDFDRDTLKEVNEIIL